MLNFLLKTSVGRILTFSAISSLLGGTIVHYAGLYYKVKKLEGFEVLYSQCKIVGESNRSTIEGLKIIIADNNILIEKLKKGAKEKESEAKKKVEDILTEAKIPQVGSKSAEEMNEWLNDLLH